MNNQVVFKKNVGKVSFENSILEKEILKNNI